MARRSHCQTAASPAATTILTWAAVGGGREAPRTYVWPLTGARWASEMAQIQSRATAVACRSRVPALPLIAKPAARPAPADLHHLSTSRRPSPRPVCDRLAALHRSAMQSAHASREINRCDTGCVFSGSRPTNPQLRLCTCSELAVRTAWPRGYARKSLVGMPDNKALVAAPKSYFSPSSRRDHSPWVA